MNRRVKARDRALLAWLAITGALACLFGCGPAPSTTDVVTLVFPSSGVGAEARVLRRQLDRFEALHPHIRVVEQLSPDAADQRHQQYVQWLNAGTPTPDVLQLDVVWTPEFAAAGWIVPLERSPSPDEWFEAALRANSWQGELYALPWFVDVGMLYYRTDLLAEPPGSLAQLRTLVERAQDEHGLPFGFVWQGARYEGLVTVYLEHLGAFGGQLLDDSGAPALDAPPALRALTFMTQSIGRFVPQAVLGWQEEQTRFAFQNGDAVAMRNWPYAFPLVNDPRTSRVAGRVGIAPMPATPQGRPTAALGGAALAINRHSRHPQAAERLIRFLTAAPQMLERARLSGQLPARRALYDRPELSEALPFDPQAAREIVEAASPRPPIPVYSELSSALQVQLHRALSGQLTPAQALANAQHQALGILDAAGLGPKGTRGQGAARAPRWAVLTMNVLALALGGVLVAAWLGRRRRQHGVERAHPRDEGRLGWLLLAPAILAIALAAVIPLAWTFYESLHAHDLRTPWLGRTFVGLRNYAEAIADGRFWGALGRTLVFTAVSVGVELLLGLALALLLDRASRGRAVIRTSALLPWALPTVAVALIWRFLFDGRGSVVNAMLAQLRVAAGPIDWLTDPILAWVPLVLADVWKTTPFVALLLLAGLQTIDRRLYEAARVDGAGRVRQLVFVTLPLLKPALLVALVFRTLDAFRVFDLPFVLTGGGPGTATEPLSLLAFTALLQNLRFGYGSALSVIVFAVAFALALLFVRLLGSDLLWRSK